MPEVRLESFEIDDSNKFAVALCKALVNLERGYSPLLIHGERGSGKTHLLSAVCTELSLAHPEVSLLYITEDAALEKIFGETNGANGGYDEVVARELGRKDFLVVDDIERLTENPAICSKFSALFSTFVDSGKQVLTASSTPIKDLRGFDKRFISRLRGGIDAHLSSPRPETRLKILKRECARLGLELDLEIMQMLMKEAGKDALYLTKLPGLLKTFATLNRQALTKERVEEFLAVIREQIGEEKHSATTEEIVGSWMNRQARKREDDLQATLRDYERQARSHEERTRQLERELEEVSSREKSAADEVASLTAKLKKLRTDLDEKSGLLKSQGKVISGEIGALAKEVKERERSAEKLKTDYEKALSEKDSKIFELEELVTKNFQALAESADQQKRADHATKSLKSELDHLKKENEDQLLALKIQLEDEEQKLVLLREEREMRTTRQQQEKTELEERYEETQEKNLILKKALDEVTGRAKELEKELAKIKELAARAAQAQKRLDSLEDALQEKERQLIKAAEIAASDAEEKKKLKEEVASAAANNEHLLNALQAERAELQKASKQTQTGLVESSARVQSLEKEVAVLRDRAEAAESEHGASKKKLKELSQNQQRAQDELDRVRSERDKLKQTFSDLTAELQSARVSLEQQEKELAQKNDEFERLAALQQDSQNRLGELEQALLLKEREEAERSRKSHEQIEKRDERLQAAEADLRKQEAALRQSHEQVEELQGRLNNLTEALCAANSQKEALELSFSESNREARAELENANKKIAQLSHELESGNAHARDVAHQLEEVQRQWQERLSRQESESAELQKTLEEKALSLQQETQETTAGAKRLRSHVAELEDRVRQRDQLLDAKEKGESDHILKLKDELNRRNEDIQNALAELAAAHEKGDALESRIAELSREAAGARGEKERVEKSSATALEHLEKQLLAAKQNMGDLQASLQEKDALAAALEKRIEERDRQAEAAQVQLSALRDKLDTIEKENTSRAGERQKLAQKIEQLTRENEDALNASEARMQEARERLKDAQDREEELLARHEAERLSSSERLERQRAEWTAREKALIDAKTTLEVEARAIAEQFHKFKTKIEEAQQDLERQTELRELAEQDSSRLVKLVEEKERQMAELQKTLSSTREAFSHKLAEGTGAKDRFVSLEQELTAKERALAAARQDFAELQADNDRLKSDMTKAEKSSGKLLSEKKKMEQEGKAREEKTKRLQEELRNLQKQVEQRGDDSSSRIQELERIVSEKDALLQTTEMRNRTALNEMAAGKDEEIARITSAHERSEESLKSQTLAFNAEMEKIKEEYGKLILQQREENEVLRARLVLLEHDQAARKTAPDHVAQTSQPEPQPDAPVSPSAVSEQQPEDVVPGPDLEQPVENAAIPVEPVNWLHSFVDFRCNDANSFTKNMAEKIARSPGKLYNPLCVYGPSNSGKTHLLHSIGSQTTTQFPTLHAKSISLDPLVEMLKGNPKLLNQWPDSLRLLIIDDFDISSVSPQDQTTLHELLSRLLKKGAQIIIASEVPPIKMENLQECMLHFIEAGLLAKLETDPQMREMEKEAMEALVAVARAPFAALEAQQQPVEQATPETAAPAEASAEQRKDFLAEFLKPDENLTIATFKEKDLFEEFEEAFKNPNKRWRNKFPLLIVEDDRQRRCHFFSALAHRLQGVFTGPVSYFSIERLVLALSRKQAVDWNALLNHLIKSHVVLVDDCDSVSKLPPSTTGYVRAIIEEILGRDILLMIGMSKKYKKEPVFGPAVKKASKKKI